jgi:hypothetical protein
MFLFVGLIAITLGVIVIVCGRLAYEGCGKEYGFPMALVGAVISLVGIVSLVFHCVYSNH